MADHFYSVVIGDGLDPSTVTAGTSTSGEAIELRVHDGVTGMNKMEILKALETLEGYFVRANAPA
jgi:hypothetical protein